MMLALSFLIAAFVGVYDIHIRGAFFIVGSVILVPSVVCFVIGITEVFPSFFKVSFVNYIWFGPCCECCNHNEEQEEEDEIIEIAV